MKTFCVAISLLALSVAAPSAMAQAIITFSSPTAITTANATLNLPLTVVGAAQFSSDETNVTVVTSSQTIVFTKSGGGVATITSSFNAADHTTSQFTGSGNANFDLALGGFNYGNPSPVTAQLQNLTPGTAYQVQLFGIDDRTGGESTRILQFSDGLGHLSANVTEGANDYVLGTFTAIGTTENISSISSSSAVFNALVVRTTVTPSATPEPGSISLLAGMLFGGACFAKRRRARKK